MRPLPLLLVAAAVTVAATARAEPPAARDAERRQRFFAAAAASLPPADAVDRTLSPYFFVDGGEPGVDVFPLASTRASVRVAGAIADVSVTQVYKNSGAKTLEALYLFPLSTRAAVHAMKMTVGDRVIEARIHEKEQARRVYERAHAEGRTASLVEQLRPNVFQMSVTNVRPGDEVRVELSYAELIVPEARTYEFVFPTVVGPRYSREGAGVAAATTAARGAGQPYLPTGAPAAHTFALGASLVGPMAFQTVASPSHKVHVERPAPAEARVALAEGDDVGNRDFVLRWSFACDAVASGLLLAPGADESHFLLMMEPPARVEPRDVLPREYIFIVDVSGSMSGFPLDVTRRLIAHLLAGLRPGDRFDILTFSGGSAVLSDAPLPASAENVQKAADFMARAEAGGGTELLPALKRALALPRADGMSRTVVVATDGYVTVEKEAFELIRSSLGRANLFAFGIGSSVNRHLIEGMARAGAGEPFVALNEQEAQATAERFLTYVRAPVAQGVQVRFDGFDAYDVEPAALPDLFAERPIVVQGKFRGEPRGRVTVSGRAAGGSFTRSLDAATAARAPGGTLGTLWARQRVARLSDFESASEREANRAEVTVLGLKYHLMTEYTSFVAADTRVRGSGAATTVQQPLPMPQGVDGESVLGNLAGTQIGEAYGVGGLGLVGVGAGGGGTGEGTIGLGNLGTIGHGAGSGTGYGVGVGYGRGAGGFGGRRAHVPEVTLGSASVRGALIGEIIRRIVRRHLNELRFCYEKELGRAPGLAGRLVLRFTIGGDGQVLAASVASSTLGDGAVEACATAAVRRWEFPRSAGAATQVDYPLTLKP